MKNLLFLTLILSLIILLSCEKENGSLFEREDENPPKEQEQAKTKNFDSPEEYLENPSVKQAVQESNIEVYQGEEPPRLAGNYIADGKISDASSAIYAMVGAKVNSLIVLYNQTSSGKISFREKVGDIIVWGSGGYITGEYLSFTIWQESKQTGEEAGLPDDVAIYVSLIMSGTKDSYGNLEAKGISIITEVKTSNPDYDVDQMVGVWWMWKADFTLEGEASLKSADAFSKFPFAKLGTLINY